MSPVGKEPSRGGSVRAMSLQIEVRSGSERYRFIRTGQNTERKKSFSPIGRHNTKLFDLVRRTLSYFTTDSWLVDKLLRTARIWWGVKYGTVLNQCNHKAVETLKRLRNVNERKFACIDYCNFTILRRGNHTDVFSPIVRRHWLNFEINTCLLAQCLRGI